MSGVKRVRQQTCSVSVWVVGAGPLRQEFTVEILEQAPDSHVVWRTLGRGDLPAVRSGSGLWPRTVRRSACSSNSEAGTWRAPSGPYPASPNASLVAI